MLACHSCADEAAARSGFACTPSSTSRIRSRPRWLARAIVPCRGRHHRGV